MRCVVVAAVLLAGCAFTPGIAPDEVQPVAGVDSGVLVSTRNCHVPGSSLCLDFENPILTPTIYDGSPGQHDATAADVQSMPRAAELAALVSADSKMLVPETPDLDITPSLTIELWVEPAKLTWDTMSLVDNDTQYGVSLAGDDVGCTIGGDTAWASSYITAAAWSHVACTYDGTTITVYVGGDVASCYSRHGPIPTGGTRGTAIAGDGYVGGIDDLPIYADALDATSICQLAGRTNCAQDCPSLGD